MKTPKRSFNFRDDGSWGAMFYNSRTWRDNSARWKRKNKEAQLKRTIARLRRIERRKLRQDKLLQLYRERVIQLRWEIRSKEMDEELQEERADAWEDRYYRLLHIAHGYCSASTCGQDQEGS